MAKNVSQSVIKRLPRYYRFLIDLEKNGISRISSGGLDGSELKSIGNIYKVNLKNRK